MRAWKGAFSNWNPLYAGPKVERLDRFTRLQEGNCVNALMIFRERSHQTGPSFWFCWFCILSRIQWHKCESVIDFSSAILSSSMQWEMIWHPWILSRASIFKETSWIIVPPYQYHSSCLASIYPTSSRRTWPKRDPKRLRSHDIILRICRIHGGEERQQKNTELRSIPSDGCFEGKNGNNIFAALSCILANVNILATASPKRSKVTPLKACQSTTESIEFLNSPRRLEFMSVSTA